MEHGSAAFIDSQNRANTFVNYSATPGSEKRRRRAARKKRTKNWKERKYDVAQIVSINRRGDGKTVVTTTARLVLRLDAGRFSEIYAENTSIDRREDTRAQ